MPSLRTSQRETIAAARRLSQTEIARLLDTTPKYIIRWEREGMPRNPDKSYDLRAVMRWLQERADARHTERAENDPRTRLAAVRADILEAQLARVRETHVEIDSVIGFLRDVTSHLRAFEEVLRPRFGEEAVAVLHDHMDQAAAVIDRFVARHRRG